MRRNRARSTTANAAALVAFALAALATLPSCTFGTSSTVHAARFGYTERGVRVALLFRGAPEVAAGWRAALTDTNPVVLTTSRDLDTLDPSATAERACRIGLELAKAGTQVDEVVVVIAHETVLSSTALVEVYDARTCRLRIKREVQPPASQANMGAGPAAAEATARKAAAELYPAGLAIVSASGRRIFTAGAAAALAPGSIYVVRGFPPGQIGSIGRVRVAARDGDRVQLEADRDLLGVGPGDELRRQTTGYQWTLYAGPLTGALRTGGETAALGGARFALRWEPSRVPVLVEGEFAVHGTPAADLVHNDGGLAVGLRWPRGRLRPFVLGELGLLGANQPVADSGFTASASGSYRGAGLGVTALFERWFLLVDARYRWLSTGGWTNADHPEMSALVPFPDRDPQAIVVGAAAGYRF
jgi:hypothetical protein